MKKIVLFLFILLIFLAPAFFVFAVTGTIDSVNKYAWSNNLGWVNFAATGGNVQVSDSTIIGYAWSQNFGWINMSPLNGGVVNTTSGTLSGEAWGANIGWIDFTGASINCSGKFTGAATGSFAGTLTFDCPNCNVQTDWTPSVGCGASPTPTPPAVGGAASAHSECNINNQCVTVSTAGANQCTNNDDCCDPHGDLNKDGVIDLTDFSILLFNWEMPLNWYNNPPYTTPYTHPPYNKCADISHVATGDMAGTVDLTDFSIMLYYWTGS